MIVKEDSSSPVGWRRRIVRVVSATTLQNEEAAHAWIFRMSFWVLSANQDGVCHLNSLGSDVASGSERVKCKFKAAVAHHHSRTRHKKYMCKRGRKLDLQLSWEF